MDASIQLASAFVEILKMQMRGTSIILNIWRKADLASDVSRFGTLINYHMMIKLTIMGIDINPAGC